MSSISSSIATSLGVGSGIDSASIVSQLVTAVREPKEKALTARQTTNDSRISALASATSALGTFSKALTDLLSGTGFSGEPASNDTSIAGVSILPGGVPTGLPAQIEVEQLASAQTLESAMLTSKTSAVGLGTLTLTAGATPYTITITSANNTLEGLATAVNAAGAGVTASVVTDNRGARLVLKGATGEDNGFTLTAGTADADLQRFTYGGTPSNMTKTADALDSIIHIDGIEMRNDSNSVDTAIPFVRIDLNKAAPGTKVTLASTEPVKTIRDLVVEFVTAYNTLKSALNRATAPGTESTVGGDLAGDSGAREMIRQLSRLTSTNLAATGDFRTLSDIGVSTNRDGTLKLDTKRLDKAIAANPKAITQMLNPAVASDTNPGLARAVAKMSESIQSETGALAISKAKYTKIQAALLEQLEKLDTDMDNYEARTSAIFAAMDTQLAGLKATQSYLEQQIAVWNGGSN